MINTPKINEDHVLNLSELIRNKQDLIRARQAAMGDLISIPNPSLFLTVRHNYCHKSLIGDSNNYLNRAMSEEVSWIVDRVYDNAIQKIDTEIAELAEKVMQNLIKANLP